MYVCTLSLYTQVINILFYFTNTFIIKDFKKVSMYKNINLLKNAQWKGVVLESRQKYRSWQRITEKQFYDSPSL